MTETRLAPSGDEVLTVPELCAVLRVGKDTVYAGCSAPEPYRWPHYRVGRGVRAAIRVLAKDVPAIRQLLSGAPAPVRQAPASVDDRTAQLRRGARRLVSTQ